MLTVKHDCVSLSLAAPTRIIFVAAKVQIRVLSGQKYAFRDKIMSVATKVLSRQIFVVTNIILSRQKFCRNKHTFVATNTCLSRQNEPFVATKRLSHCRRERRNVCVSHATSCQLLNILQRLHCSLTPPAAQRSQCSLSIMQRL